jgi:hypothetical protein
MESIATELLNAQNEDEVDKILNYSFFKNGEWKPLGRLENNYAIVENQQAHPVASLVEKITNAIDAILLKECKSRKIDPAGKSAPDSMDEAVTLFFGAEEKRRTVRSRLAELIQIRADGLKSNPNLFIIDRGEGQRPEDFEETFLSLLRSKSGKRDIKFVQGRYYMGGSGVLPYCGEKGYEIIVSRSAILGGKWGWAIVRKNREREQYEYFVSNNKIPSFDSKEFFSQESGTIIKLFNYKLEHPSTITTDLRDDLDLFIFDMYLPVHLVETRPELPTKVPRIIVDGNKGKISNNLELLESQYKMPIIIEADFGKYGKRKIEIYLFKADSDLLKEKVKTKRNRKFTTDEMAVFFTINGQTHSSFGRSFIKTRCKKPQLEKDLLVHIDFSGISGADRVDIFPPSRDRMKNTTVTKWIEETIQDCIKNDETLKTLNEIRFRKLVEKGVVDFKFVTQFFSQLIQKNPSLVKYLKSGGKVKYVQNIGTKITGEYKPPFFPNTFKIKGWDEVKGIYTKVMPVDSQGAHILFELNAPDDYFDRSQYPGALIVNPQDMVSRRKLLTGVLDLRLKPTKGAKHGEIQPVSISVTRHSDKPLSIDFQVKYIAPTLTLPKKPVEKYPSAPPKVSDLGVPEPILVKKDDWGNYDPPWTGQEIVRIQETNGNGEKTSDIAIYINVDSDDLHDYLIRNRIGEESKRETVRQWYELDILLYSFVTYIELKTKYGDNERIQIDEIVPITMKGISKTVLDLHINEEMLKLLAD